MPVLESAPAAGDFSLHDLFQQQTMAMLDRSDLDEEQKQSILVAMNCPCCGGCRSLVHDEAEAEEVSSARLRVIRGGREAASKDARPGHRPSRPP